MKISFLLYKKYKIILLINKKLKNDNQMEIKFNKISINLLTKPILSNGFLLACAICLIIIINFSCRLGKPIVSNPATLNNNQDSVRKKLKYINTSFENASQLDWEVDSSGIINLSLIYDHERSSSNRAAGHWYFQIQAEPGCDLTLILKNFDNIWNGRRDIPVSDSTNCLISEDGINWAAIPTDFITGYRLKFQVHMKSDKLYVASVEPYTLSDLEKLKAEISPNPLVAISTIGKTVEGRAIEIIRVGNTDAPYSIFIRARAHSWEPGGNWVLQGLIRSLLQNDGATYLKKYCIYIMPLANKDGVAHGRSRFNSLGKDLNRNWDQEADSNYSPENYALETWLKDMIRKGKKPDLAIDLHNDSEGNLHLSRPNINLTRYLENMKRFETLLYKYTWFTEGAKAAEFRNPGSFGEGLLERYGIDAFVYELNYEWIAGLKKQPFGKDWELLGKQLRDVFFDYFNK